MINISVIIPVYRPGSEFEACINSLENQNFDKSRFEVILILNGERSPYEEFILNYIKKTSIDIKYFYTEEKGVSNARNYGIQKAAGEYITFIDSDDWVSDNYLSTLYEESKLTGNLILSNVICYDETNNNYYDDFLGKMFQSLDSNKRYSHLRTKSFFSVPWGKLILTKLCKQYLFDDNFEYGEDALFMFSIEPYLNKAQKSSGNAIYFRRISSDSLSHKKRSRREICKIHFSLLKEYWKIYSKNITKYNLIFFINRNLAILQHICRGK